MSKWEKLINWMAHTDSVHSVMFTPDSKKIITSSKDIRVWKIDDLMNCANIVPDRKIICEN